MNKRSVKGLIAIASIITLTSLGVIACDRNEEKEKSGTTASQSVSEDDVKEIRISDNNIYESGVDGIFEVLDKKLNLPEKLFMQNDFVLNFDSKGDITSFKTLIYGVKKDGNLESYDINYSSKESNKIKVVLGTEVGANYDEAKLIEPLKLIAKNVPLRDQANKWGAESYELIYQGKQTLYNDEKNIFIDKDGKVLNMKGKGSLIDGYGFSICVPDRKQELGVVTYGKMLKEIKHPSRENAEEQLGEGEFETETVGSVKYRLKITDAAAGARAYALYKTEDAGGNWYIVNEEVFGNLGVATGLMFVQDTQGFVTLANKSGTKTELFKTSNSGETFKEVELPDRSVSGIENANEIFDTPEVPTVEDGGISMLIGQGNDGDYNGGSKLKFMSYNLGSTWKFVGEIKK